MLNTIEESRLEQEFTSLKGKIRESLFSPLSLSLSLLLSLSLGFFELKGSENGWNGSSLTFYRPAIRVQEALIN